MSGHHCHAVGCLEPTRPTLLMCRRHWAMVPEPLRLDVVRAYRPGQCSDKQPSRAWVRASAAARLCVARKENRTLAVSYLENLIAKIDGGDATRRAE